MLLLLLFKVVSKKQTEALLYYICDSLLRITFSIPLAFIVFYFLIYRFCGSAVATAVTQAIVFGVLFVVFDCLIKWEIKAQIGVNYFKIHDKV
jgi:hypothetical protein